MSDLSGKKEVTKEEFAANEIREFCKYVMHPDSDLHKDAKVWIEERLQMSGVEKKSDNNHNIPPFLESEDQRLEALTECNANIASQFMNHCKDEGYDLPDSLFESFFDA